MASANPEIIAPYENMTIMNVTAYTGDVLYIPSQCSIVWASLGYTGPSPSSSLAPAWLHGDMFQCCRGSSSGCSSDGPHWVCFTSFGPNIDQNEAIEIYTCITNQLGESICDFAKTNSPFQCTRQCYDYKPFSSSTVAIPETLLTSAESTCNSGGAERCSSQSEATDYFKCQRTSIGDSVCDFAKTNSPFQCTRKQPIEAMQRVSLSYAGAILVYSGLSVFFSWLMQYRKARIEKLRKVVASKGIVLTPENHESTV